MAAAQGVAEKMTGLQFTHASKAGVDGRLFGSVTNSDITDALKVQGFEVSKSQIKIVDGNIKAIGEYAVQVALFTDVVADITLLVTPAI